MVWTLPSLCMMHNAVALALLETSSLLQLKTADIDTGVTESLDNVTKATCDRCAAHAAFAGLKETSNACPGCDCGRGLQLCGCAHCENPPLSMLGETSVRATWDNPASPTCDRCAAHAAFMGFMETKHACPKCDCGHGIELCGCAHCNNVAKPIFGELELLQSEPLESAAEDAESMITPEWDDPTKPTCERCAVYAAFAGFLETSSACPGCDCGHGVQLCGCARCENAPVSLVSEAVVTATWDNPKKSTCDRCAAHAAFMGFAETMHACPKCDCGNGIQLCGCAHCRNVPMMLEFNEANEIDVNVTASWDDPEKPTCDRCASHAAFAGFQKTRSACPGCDCGNGLKMCGCAVCDKPPQSLVSDFVVAGTWDDSTNTTCDRCAAHAAVMGFIETKHACPDCDCGNGIELCGCAHCINPPVALHRVELEDQEDEEDPEADDEQDDEDPETDEFQ